MDEIEQLKAENEKLIKKNIDLSRENRELINKISTKEVSLKVNGTKIKGLSGTDKARLWYQNELISRENKIKELDDFITSFQNRVYDYNFQITSLEKELDKLKAENEELKKKIIRLENSKYMLEKAAKKLAIEEENYKQALEMIEQYCIDTLELQDVHTIKQDILKYIKQAKGEE